ncbi:hypothetical protein DNTS_033855 [Danionella cerebrum]|uniref:Uncharacterized protein n=1 Tax=Danionella cerebrum TaxID=2873325 RepID=A0A553RPH0_9TELE|nr:hypothetical protein DNTS_033855 [Danionella translucida]
MPTADEEGSDARSLQTERWHRERERERERERGRERERERERGDAQPDADFTLLSDANAARELRDYFD